MTARKNVPTRKGRKDCRDHIMWGKEMTFVVRIKAVDVHSEKPILYSHRHLELNFHSGMRKLKFT